MTRLYPDDPGYAAAIAALLAKAQRLNPRFRLATADEKQCLDPAHLYSFTGADGRMIAPVFVLDHDASPHAREGEADGA